MRRTRERKYEEGVDWEFFFISSAVQVELDRCNMLRYDPFFLFLGSSEVFCVGEMGGRPSAPPFS